MAISKVTLTAVRVAYEIWGESKGEDVSGLMDLMDDKVHLSTLADGASPLEFSKPCHGKAELGHYFAGLLGDWDLLEMVVEEVISERDCVIVLIETSWRNRRTDKRFDSPAAHAWRFQDGKAVQVRLFFDTARWSHAARVD